MNTRTEVINKLITEHDYSRYLEIGYQEGVNFAGVQCEVKLGVDPDDIIPRDGDDLVRATSDAFFEDNTDVWDLIFIDGLHHADQVARDMVNAMRCLSEDGAIVLHDLNPAEKEHQEVPLRPGIWNGDCWRAWYEFVSRYPGVRTEFYPFDHGVGVIYPAGDMLVVEPDMDTTFEEYRALLDTALADGRLPWTSPS